jgi:hypothetical protein
MVQYITTDQARGHPDESFEWPKRFADLVSNTSLMELLNRRQNKPSLKIDELSRADGGERGPGLRRRVEYGARGGVNGDSRG